MQQMIESELYIVELLPQKPIRSVPHQPINSHMVASIIIVPKSSHYTELLQADAVAE